MLDEDRPPGRDYTGRTLNLALFLLGLVIITACLWYCRQLDLRIEALRTQTARVERDIHALEAQLPVIEERNARVHRIQTVMGLMMWYVGTGKDQAALLQAVAGPGLRQLKWDHDSGKVLVAGTRAQIEAVRQLPFLQVGSAEGEALQARWKP